MPIEIENNKFYKTYTTFLKKNTITAEKTINGRKYGKKKLPTDLYPKFIESISAGGLLLIPIVLLGLTKRDILSQIKHTKKSLFKLMCEENPSFINKFYIGYNKVKHKIVETFWDFAKTSIRKKEVSYSKLNKKSNESLWAKATRKIDNFFIDLKIKSLKKKKYNIKDDFIKLKKSLEKQLDIIEKSENSNVKIALPKEILKNDSELPMIMKLNKTRNGKNRADEIKKLINEIENILKDDKFDSQTINKLTNSCETIFIKAENILFKMNERLNEQYPQAKKLIKEIYQNFTKYKFAQNLQEEEFLDNQQIRKKYVEIIQKKLQELKNCKIKDKLLDKHVLELEKIITEETKPENMGIIEKIRMLLKCNDIDNDIIIQGTYPSLLKHYRTEEYLETKALLNKFAKNLKNLDKNTLQTIPNAIDDIKKGNLFLNLSSSLIPTGVLLYQYNTNKKNKLTKRRNLLSFLVGSLTILGLNYGSFKSKTSIVILGLVSTFITSKLHDKFFKK